MQLRVVLDQFFQASGQKMNLSKSSMFFNSTGNEDFKREIMVLFGIQHVVNPDSYLGLPTICGRSRKDTLADLKERIINKIKS